MLSYLCICPVDATSLTPVFICKQPDVHLRHTTPAILASDGLALSQAVERSRSNKLGEMWMLCLQIFDLEVHAINASVVRNSLAIYLLGSF